MQKKYVASATYFEMTRTGFEPVLPPWKGGVLTTWPTGHGSEGRTRTYDQPVNSRLLYHWATSE